MPSVEAYRALVERLQIEARRAPRRYKTKLALLALAGFSVLAGSVLLAFGMSVGLIVLLAALKPALIAHLFKVIWLPVAFGWLVLKSLWVRFSPPDGHRLGAGEAPALVAEVERLRQAAQAPPLAGIFIDGDFNAAAVSVPRALGLLGHRHYLLLGLPLMQTLDRDQFAGVVAHEFGHFGGRHGAFSGWIYRVRASWYRLLDALSAKDAWSARMFARFFVWYAPYFNAYSFVLARDNEYEADAVAARIVGKQAIGHALIRTCLGSDRLDREFWPAVRRQLIVSPEPPPRLYGDMAASLRAPHAGDGERLRHFLAERPGFDDTHPTLSQRLRALGVEPDTERSAEVSAAEALLGDLQPDLVARFSAEWRSGVEQAWQTKHRQHAADRARLDALDAMAEHSPAETVEHARLTEALVPGVELVPLFRRAVERAPDDAFAHLRLGDLLLERGEVEGAVLMQRAIILDPDCAEIALERLAQFERQVDHRGLRDFIDAESERAHSRQVQDLRARRSFSDEDAFAPSALDAATLDAFRGALDRLGHVAKAWIARKRIDAAAHGVPHFVVLVDWRGLVLSESASLQRLVDAIELPGSLVVISASGQRTIAKRVRAACGNPSYVRRS